MEIKSKQSSNRMGEMRRNFLESASYDYSIAMKIASSSGELSGYRSVESLLDAFEFTLDPGTEAKKEILREKESINEWKKLEIQKYQQAKELIGFFERQDIERSMPVNIEVSAVGRRLENCWDVSKRHGLFND